MVTQTTTTFPVLPEFARQPVADIAATVAEELKTPLKVPLQEVAGLSPTQVSAMNLAQQGIGSFQPFLHCLLYTSPSPRDLAVSRMPSAA